MPDDQNLPQNPIPTENSLPTSPQEPTEQAPQDTTVSEPLDKPSEAPEAPTNSADAISLVMDKRKLGQHHHLIDKVAIYAGIISGLALYPQIYIVIITKNITGLSSVSFFIIFLNSVVWIMYGIHRRLMALIISSVLNALASAILILLIL